MRRLVHFAIFRIVFPALLLCLVPAMVYAQFSEEQLPPDMQPFLRHARQASMHRLHAEKLLSKYDYVGAIAEYNQAYALDKTTPLGDGNVAEDLKEIGMCYLLTSQYLEALKSFQQVLPIVRRLGYKQGEAITLNNIGELYEYLSQDDKAADSFQQALRIDRRIGYKLGTAYTLGNLGLIYDNKSESAKAVDFYRQALPIYREIEDREGEATVLNNLGGAYRNLNRDDIAYDLYRRALHIEREVNDRDMEATSLNNLGYIYVDGWHYNRAIDFFQQALLLVREVKDKAGEAKILGNMMLSWKSLGKSGLAIFYGKQSVNALQSIRADINGLDQKTRKAYLASIEDGYHYLADLLISQGRLPEAEQVLRMLKEREFYEYLHPDPDAPPPAMDGIPYTPREGGWNGRYEEAAKPLSGLGRQEQTLRAIKTRTPAQETELTGLRTRLQTAADALIRVQKQTAADFSGPVTADDTPPTLTATKDLQQALPPRTAALYTIVAPDKLIVIVVTHDTQKAYSSAIKADALYDQVRAFRQALVNTDVDPSPLAAGLYRLILGPVQKDLDAANATTLLFSLDDALRYIPPAALYDPDRKQYLAERYQTALITLAAAPPAATAAPPSAILGLGTSDRQGDLPALPGVRDELMALVHEPTDTGGLLPGRRLLDAQFTRAALEDGLKTGGYPFVHVASHFSLQGTEDESFLLLGDGSRLSVKTLAEDPKRFQGVSLLTLSACDTAMEVRRSSGREVEGIATLAQSLGAGAVLASLWPVSDAATPPLMGAFYGYRRAHPQASLAEALQAAQWTLLHGHPPASGDMARRGTEPVETSPPGTLAAFPSGLPRYAHPFYWASFILIGNWR